MEDFQERYEQYKKAYRKYEKQLGEYEYNFRRYSSPVEIKLGRGIIQGLFAGALTFAVSGGLTHYLSGNDKLSLVVGAVPASIFAFLNVIGDFIPPQLPEKPSKSDFLMPEEIGELNKLEELLKEDEEF